MVPPIFWYFSIGGALVLLAYAIHKTDIVFILGQSMGLFIYARNLQLIRNEKRRVTAAKQAPKSEIVHVSATVSERKAAYGARHGVRPPSAPGSLGGLTPCRSPGLISDRYMDYSFTADRLNTCGQFEFFCGQDNNCNAIFAVDNFSFNAGRRQRSCKSPTAAGR